LIFSSYHFLFIFLPVALAGYGVASRLGQNYGAAWLAVCSIIFYGIWNVYFVGLLLGSIVFNYTIGNTILKSEDSDRLQNWLLTFGIAGNLLVLFYFKYFAALFNFASQIGILHSETDLNIVLPLGISFFTFTQIGYLMDCREGLGKKLDPIHYVVFVTFFPHLIAGPILHIREIAPQILDAATYRLRSSNLAVGFSFFVIGLSKKVLLADHRASFADLGFASPTHLDLTMSWLTALNYSVQLYFDFSGYSDMAIGLAYMFGIKFPLNFNSPYKATNIIDFWQRWHMTLTRYLTLLLFNPVALWVTRRRMAQGKPIRSKQLSLDAFMGTIILPTVYTMFLAGIWHGAGFQFVVFGLLHAFYLSVNHAWRNYGTRAPVAPRSWVVGAMIVASQVALTYLCVLVAQIFFRAASASDALGLLSGMIGLHGSYIPQGVLNSLGGFGTHLVGSGWAMIGVPDPGHPKEPLGLLWRYLIIFLAPNSQQIMSLFSPYLAKVTPPRLSWLQWKPQAAWAIGLAVLFFLDLMSLTYSPPFLYFQF
jgi:alginate O-acetyltransferase complex protein AlgI